MSIGAVSVAGVTSTLKIESPLRQIWFSHMKRSNTGSEIDYLT